MADRQEFLERLWCYWLRYGTLDPWDPPGVSATPVPVWPGIYGPTEKDRYGEPKKIDSPFRIEALEVPCWCGKAIVRVPNALVGKTTQCCAHHDCQAPEGAIDIQGYVPARKKSRAVDETGEVSIVCDACGRTSPWKKSIAVLFGYGWTVDPDLCPRCADAVRRRAEKSGER